MKNLKNQIKANRSTFMLNVFNTIVFTALSAVIPLIVKGIVDFAVNKDMHNLKRYIFLLIIISIITIISSIFKVLIESKYTSSVKQTLRYRLIRGIEKLPFNKFSTNDRAKYISMFNNDINMVTEDYYKNLLDIIGCAATIIFSLSALLSINIWMAIIILVSSILMTFNSKLFSGIAQKRKLAYADSLKKYNGFVNDFLEGINIIKTYNFSILSIKKMDLASGDVGKSEYSSGKVGAMVYGVSGVLQKLKDFLIISLGVIFILNGKMTSGDLLATVQLSEVIAVPMEYIAMLLNIRSSIKPVREGLEEYMISTEDNKIDAKKSFDSIKKIEMKNVSFSVNGIEILKNINLGFEAGKKYLILGDSGSGKSTILKMLSKMEDGYKGSILVDGEELKNIDSSDYYSKVCQVFQSPFLFQMDILNNITLNKEVESSKVSRLVNSLNLSNLLGRFGHQLLNPEKIDALSGGEKQRIALGRALARNCSFYLLDEVTSALDKENSTLIERLLLKSKCCIINVSHKPSEELLDSYDKIIRINDGTILNA